MTHKGSVIVGNWKMNPDTLREAGAKLSSISRRASKAKKTAVIIAPSAAFIAPLARKAGRVVLAAQDVSSERAGAFTGSVSAFQVHDAGAEYTIIGHSERRAAGDTDEVVAAKAKQALAAGLRIILCVGESERDSHARYFETVRRQVLTVMTAIDKKLARSLMIAYEPVWAIGRSYDSALKPSDIHEMSIYIKKVAAESLGKKGGLGIPVLYGGSVDLENAKIILREGVTDGLLIGRQSLDPKAFGDIIDYADSL